MAKTTTRRRRQKYCIGDFRDRITLHVRAITEPDFQGRDFGEDFKDGVDVWALVQTAAGRTFFDGVNQDTALSHTIIIRHRDDVTSETWIELADGGLVDIVNVEDLEERKEYLRLRCVERGTKTQEAAKT